MAPLVNLGLATAAFAATHLVAGTPARAKVVRALGEWPYRGLYSLAALATLGWMIAAFAAASAGPLLWRPLLHLPPGVMLLAFILVACGYARNPTAVGAERLLRGDQPARGIIRITRHPLMWAVILWSGAHILANADPRATIFFGGFLLVAVLGSLSLDRRKALEAGNDWTRFRAVTSHVPFVAIAQGRNRLVWSEIGWTRPLAGIGLFLLIFALHPWLFGVRPY